MPLSLSSTGPSLSLSSTGPTLKLGLPSGVFSVSSLPAHASTHEDGGSDELQVEALATAGAAGTAPVSDGAGGLSMQTITATAGGTDRQIQFNDNGSLGGATALFTAAGDIELAAGNALSWTGAGYPQIKGDTPGDLVFIRNDADTEFANFAARTLRLSTDAGALAWVGIVDDDRILLLNGLQTDAPEVLQFGGTTSAFPGLGRVGQSLIVKTADNTGFADMILRFLRFEGTSATEVGLKKAAGKAEIQARLADDSDFCAFTSGSLVCEGANLSDQSLAGVSDMVFSNGTRFEEVSDGILRSRDSGLSLGILRGATPVGNDDYATKLYVDNQIGTVDTLQEVYDNSPTGTIGLDNAIGGLIVRDDGSTGTLFGVESSAPGNLFTVSTGAASFFIDINTQGQATDWDLALGETEALSFDCGTLAGLMRLDTVGGAEQVRIGGAVADKTNFPAARAIIGPADIGFPDASISGLAVGAEADATTAAVGLTATAVTNTGNQGTALTAKARVSATGDTGSALAGNFLSIDTHAGGENAALTLFAANGATNYALKTSGGDFSTGAATDWDLTDNVFDALSFDAPGYSGLLVLDTTNGAERVRIANGAGSGEFPATRLVVSNSDTGYAEEGQGAIIGESASDGATGAFGILGVGATNGAQLGSGVLGAGLVTASSDTADSKAGVFYAFNTHTGGDNLALELWATGGANNYAIKTFGGDILLEGSTLLQWGLTSSEPMFKRNSAVIEARLADDSDFAIMRADSPVASDDVATKGYVDGGFVAAITSTDEAIARFNGTSGALQDSNITINDTGDIMPVGDVTQDMGSSAMRWDKVRGQQLVGVQGNQAPTFGANGAGGIIAGRSQGNGATLQIGGGSYPPFAVLGNAYGSAPATARLRNQGGGSMLVGSAFAYSGSVTTYIDVDGSSFGSFTGGYAYCTGGSTTAQSQIRNQASGAFVWGYPLPTGTGVHRVRAFTQANGSFTSGRTSGAGNAQIDNNGQGAFVQGFVSATNASGTGRIISASGANGAFVQGMAQANTASVSEIRGSAQGVFAHGFARNGYAITASGTGAFACGDTGGTGNITASASNSVQFGPGVNSRADTLQVGTQLNFKGTSGLTGTPFVGCFAVNAGYVYIYSNAQWCKVTNAVL